VKGYLTLGEVQRKTNKLCVDCTACDRKGQYDVGKLIGEHGTDYSLVELRINLAGDCPRMVQKNYSAQCGVRYPELGALFAKKDEDDLMAAE
jgi:hypothetical protein